MKKFLFVASASVALAAYAGQVAQTANCNPRSQAVACASGANLAGAHEPSPMRGRAA